MTALPGQLALAVIADGSQIIASDHRNNYAGIQTPVNSLITALGAGVSGQVLGLSPAATAPVFPPGYQLNRTQITSPVNIASTTEATGTNIFPLLPAITFDGTEVMVEFFSPLVLGDSNAASDGVTISLFEGATQITRLAVGNTVAAASQSMPFTGKYFFTPSAASHTYTVTAYATSTTGTPRVFAGSGGTNGYAPAYVRFTKV